MRFALPILAFLSLLMAGCGGGAGSAGPAVGKAVLSGGVVEIDGSTANLSGVSLVLVDTGEQVVSGPDGRFLFRSGLPAQLTLALDDGPDDDGTDDDAPDDDGPDGDDDAEGHETSVDVHGVREGERIHIRVRVRDGRFERVEILRSGHNEREVEVDMVRTDTNDDPDMEGEVELEVRDDRERFKVEVEHAEPGRELEAVVIDGDGNGNEASLGILTVDSFGEAEWKLDSRVGSVFPFGVGSVMELEGFEVQVRDAATAAVLLRADVPEVPLALPTDDEDDDGDDDDEEDSDDDDDDGDHDDDGDDDGDTHGARERGRTPLTAIEAGLSGHIEVRRRPEDARERFEIEAENLVPGREVEFFIEDVLGSGVFVSLGSLAADLEGEAELELDTGDGDALPLGVTQVADLVGFAVEVRDATTGAVILTGTVPALILD